MKSSTQTSLLTLRATPNMAAGGTASYSFKLKEQQLCSYPKGVLA